MFYNCFIYGFIINERKMNKIFNLKIFKFLMYSAVFCALVGIVMLFLQNAVICGDDLWTPYSLYPNHGRYVSFFQTKMYCDILPQFLEIHPNTLANTVVSFVKGIYFAAVCFLITFFAYLGRKKTCVRLVFPVFLFVLYAKLLMPCFDQIYCLTYHFDYVSGVAFYLLFLLLFAHVLIEKNNIIEEKWSNLYFALVAIAALSDTFAIIGFWTLLLFWGQKVFFYLRNNHFENIKELAKSFYEKYEHLLKMTLVFLLFGIMAIYGLIHNQNIMGWVDPEYMQSENNILYFIKEYFFAIFFHHKAILCLIILLSGLIFLKKEKNGNYLILASSMLFGACMLFAMLICGGDESFYEKGELWIWHDGLQLTLKLIYLTVLMLLGGHYFSLLKTSFYKKIFVSSTVFLMLISIFPLKNIIEFYTYKFYEMKQERVVMYKAEKIYLFYSIKERKNINLPISILSYSDIASTFWIGETDRDAIESFDDFENFKNKKFKKTNPKYLDTKESIMDIVFKNTYFRKKYIPKIYDMEVDKLPLYQFDEKNDALDEFFQCGGSFTDEEIKHLSFNKLKDFDFVIGKKK